VKVMNPSHRIFSLLIFLISILASRQASLAIFHPRIQVEPIRIEVEADEKDLQSLTQQINLIIIHTSDFTGQQLVSVWWVAISPQSPITLVNLFPTIDDNTNHRFEQVFSLSLDELTPMQINPNFLRYLATLRIPWDGFIVVDNHALAILTDYLGGVKHNGQTLNGKAVLSKLDLQGSFASRDLNFQVNLWEIICKKSIFAGSPKSLELIRQDLHQHTVISPHFPLTLTDYQNFSSNPTHLDCKVISEQDQQIYEITTNFPRTYQRDK
jgi:hypothetical protein